MESIACRSRITIEAVWVVDLISGNETLNLLRLTSLDQSWKS